MQVWASPRTTQNRALIFPSVTIIDPYRRLQEAQANAAGLGWCMDCKGEEPHKCTVWREAIKQPRVLQNSCHRDSCKTRQAQTGAIALHANSQVFDVVLLVNNRDEHFIPQL